MSYQVPGQNNANRAIIPFSARLIVLSPSLLLYAVACVLPAIDFVRVGGGSSQRWIGFEALLLGWQGLFVGQFGWFANPLLWLAYLLVLLRQFTAGAIMAILALALALTSTRLLHQQVPADEGGVNKLEVVAFGAGFYLWIACLLAAVVIPLIAALLLRYRKASQPQ